MIALVLSTVISACKKDKDTASPVDARDKFLGTWKGDIIPSGLPPTLPASIKVTYIFSKNPNNANELLINATVDPALQSSVTISNPLTATITGSSYTYKEFNITLTFPTPPPPPLPGVITAKCTGTGTINAEGKVITESGNWSNTTFSLSNNWSSTLTKQP